MVSKHTRLADDAATLELQRNMCSRCQVELQANAGQVMHAAGDSHPVCHPQSLLVALRMLPL